MTPSRPSSHAGSEEEVNRKVGWMAGFRKDGKLTIQRTEETMITGSSRIFCSIALAFLAACAATISATERSGAGDVAQVTILYDAFGKDSGMQKDWGYAALVEYGGKRILFDTGNNPSVLERNVKAKHVDLSKLDFVVMSHR